MNFTSSLSVLLLAFSLCFYCAGAFLHSHDTITTSSRRITTMMADTTTRPLESQREKIKCDNIFFIEMGFGNDSHGQSSTKAAVRACRNAIEFNSIPSIKRLIPEVRVRRIQEYSNIHFIHGSHHLPSEYFHNMMK